MSDIGIGKLIECERFKDAIHIAVAPVTAAERLAPGQDIGLVAPDTAGRSNTPIGIVDPFIKGLILPGQRFYMFLYPGTITSLRHDWVHPAFEDPVPAEPVLAVPVRAALVPLTPVLVPPALESFEQDSSRRWIEGFADRIRLDYDEVMKAARIWIERQDYYIFDGRDTPEECDNESADFWKHYEILTGTKVEAPKENFFSCSC